MGDRGGTATDNCTSSFITNYTRWEIGGEPQRYPSVRVPSVIIPDGRSGGNRNAKGTLLHLNSLYPMGDRGGTATPLEQGSADT